MARILNLIIVILELIAFRKSFKANGFKAENFAFYTQISNCLTLVSSLLLVILGQKPYVEIFRMVSVTMLIMTFFVTACILVPVTKNPKGLLFSGSGCFHHLIIPILSTLSYLLAEDRAPLSYVWLPVALTLVYGLVMLYLNAKGKIDGPYPFFMVNRFGTKLICLWMAGLFLVTSVISFGVGYHKPMKTDLKYVYVHGLAGWGSYDTMNEFFPYWGLSGGSVIRYMNNQGYDSYAASVDPTGSAWDRACELYAQLTGTKVDYGAAHSEAAGHERFGEDFTGRALLGDFDSSEIVLIGHSFGGATIRLFSEILRNGSKEELDYAADDTSDFFKGGNGDHLFALITLAAPTNGTTAYDMYEDENFDFSSIEIPEEYERFSGAVSQGTKAETDGRASYDYAAYDMHIDNALALNETISTFSDVYYFSYPCASTDKTEDGSVTPNPDITENIFMKGAIYMSKYTGATKGGFVLDETWQANDGLVNEVSARAPFNAPQKDFESEDDLSTGIWYVMPTFRGDHMSLQGGLTKRVSVKPFYMEMASMLADLRNSGQ